MVNLVFDGNYLMHKTMYVFHRASRGPILDTHEDRTNFIKKFMMDFAYAIRKFQRIKKVIITWDDYSWRKNVEIDQNDGYKSNRVKDENKVNWKEFDKIQSRITEILSQYNFIISKIPNAEGDDLMFFWKDYFISKGENVVILSGDRDITQLVELRGNAYSLVYDSKSTKRILFAPVGFLSFLDKNNSSPASILDMSFMIESNDDIKKLMSDAIYEEVVPDDVVWEKMISGDSGDAVPPVWTWTKSKDDKISNFKVTAKKAKLIKEDIMKALSHMHLGDPQELLPFVINGIKQYHKQDADEQIVFSRLKRNKILVELSFDTIPSDIHENFKIHADMVKNISTPTVSAYNNRELLKNTEYDMTVGIQSDFFSNASRTDVSRGKKLF